MGMRFVLIYAKKNEPMQEIKCKNEECFHLLGASAAMISFEDGDEARRTMKDQDLFVELQTTSQDNFFFAIDHRGRLAEVGLFLYPSLHFLAYEAQW
jgi:thioredoxin-related protein